MLLIKTCYEEIFDTPIAPKLLPSGNWWVLNSTPALLRPFAG